MMEGADTVENLCLSCLRIYGRLGFRSYTRRCLVAGIITL